MAGNTLNISASLQCPHGGTVQIIPSNPRVRAGGGAIATANDTFIVVGCPFQLPTTPPTPSPCVKVQWIVTDLRSTAGGAPTLSMSHRWEPAAELNARAAYRSSKRSQGRNS